MPILRIELQLHAAVGASMAEVFPQTQPLRLTRARISQSSKNAANGVLGIPGVHSGHADILQIRILDDDVRPRRILRMRPSPRPGGREAPARRIVAVLGPPVNRAHSGLSRCSPDPTTTRSRTGGATCRPVRVYAGSQEDQA